MFYYPEYTDCVLDDDLFLWSNKTGRLISDNTFRGIDDDDEEAQTTASTSTKGNDTSPPLTTADDSNKEGAWKVSLFKSKRVFYSHMQGFWVAYKAVLIYI